MSQTTLDFNASFPASYVESLVVNTPILEDGYRLAGSGNPDEPIQFISYGSEYGPGGASEGSIAYNGPGVISNPGSYLTGTRLSRSDGQPFDLVSIQLDSVYTFFEVPRAAIVTFTGQREAGGPVTATFTTDTAPGLQTFSLPAGFTGLSSVSWNYETEYVPPEPTQNTDYQQNQWDNIVVRAGSAPPPGGQTLPGTDGPDLLSGGAGADSLSGAAGSDDLRGLDGADTLDGGADFDGLVGGGGADRFVLTSGNEWIEDFAPGTDKLVLRNGFDPAAVTSRAVTFAWGESGLEVRYGAGAGDVVSMRGINAIGSGDVIAEGGTTPPPPPPPGGETVPGTGGPDNLSGGPGADSLSGGGGSDDLRGLDGADTLDGGADSDGLVGGGGADRFVLTSGPEWIEDFTPGTDKLVLRNGFDPAAVTTRAVTFAWGEAGFEVRYGPGAGDVASLRGVSALQPGDVVGEGTTTPPPLPPPGGETLSGTDGPDNLSGGPGPDSLSGGAGSDDLRGLGGADFLDGGADFDGLVGGEGADDFVLTSGREWIEDFAPGTDRMVLRNGFDPSQVTSRSVTFEWGETGFEVRYGPGAGDIASLRGVSALQPGDIVA